MTPLLSFLPDGDESSFGLSAGTWSSAQTQTALQEFPVARPTMADGHLIVTYLRWLASQLIIPKPGGGGDPAPEPTTISVQPKLAASTGGRAASTRRSEGARSSVASTRRTPPSSRADANARLLEQLQRAVARDPGADLRPILQRFIRTAPSGR